MFFSHGKKKAYLVGVDSTHLKNMSQIAHIAGQFVINYIPKKLNNQGNFLIYFILQTLSGSNFDNIEEATLRKEGGFNASFFPPVFLKEFDKYLLLDPRRNPPQKKAARPFWFFFFLPPRRPAVCMAQGGRTNRIDKHFVTDDFSVNSQSLNFRLQNAWPSWLRGILSGSSTAFWKKTSIREPFLHLETPFFCQKKNSPPKWAAFTKTRPSSKELANYFYRNPHPFSGYLGG